MKLDQKYIDILCYYDQNHQVLYDYFFNLSYKKYINQNIFQLFPRVVQSADNNSHYLSNHWSKMLIDRYNFILSYIETHQNYWAIFSDIDIVFLNDIADSILNIIQSFNNTIDIFYMKESPYIQYNKEVNGGFFLFKCTNTIYNYFKDVQECTAQMEKPNDQLCVNKFLSTKTIPFAYLPPVEYSTNNGRMDTTK